MTKRTSHSPRSVDEDVGERRLEMQHLQAIEGNHLTAGEFVLNRV
jgi:hypothetical protein